MTKCTCGKSNCPVELTIDTEGRTLWFVDKCGVETIMYLDKNTAQEIIKKLAEI
jgi:hypothetical protein